MSLWRAALPLLGESFSEIDGTLRKNKAIKGIVFALSGDGACDTGTERGSRGAAI